MNKKFSDFPEIFGDYPYQKINIEHFKSGLDTNIVFEDSKYNIANLYARLKDETINENKIHVLYLLIRNSYIVGFDKEIALQNKIFFKKEILNLYNKGSLDSKVMELTAFAIAESSLDFDLLEFLLEEKIVSPNIKFSDGRSLLMFVDSKLSIKKLIDLGADVNLIIDNEKSNYYGMNVFDYAISQKQKGWVEYLKPYVPQSFIDKYENEALKEFRSSKPNKQFKLFIKTLKEKNTSLINEIKNNQEKYKNVIEFKDGHGKYLVDYCISGNNKDILAEILTLNFYQNKNFKERMAFEYEINHEDHVEKQKMCYTSYALNLKRSGVASLLYDNGFKNNNFLIEVLENDRVGDSTVIFEKMIADGYNPNLSLWDKHFSIFNLDNKLNSMSKEELESFISSSHLLKANNLKLYLDKNVMQHIKDKYSYESSYELKNVSIKLMCKALKKQEEIDSDSFYKNFNEFVRNIGNNSEQIAKPFINIILSEFKNKKEKIYELVGQDKPWIIEISKQNLDSYLEKLEKLESKKIKI